MADSTKKGKKPDSEDVKDGTGAGAADTTVETAAVDDVTAILKEQGVDDLQIAAIKEKLGVETLADLAIVTEVDLVSAGVKTIPARNLMNKLNPPKNSTVTTTQLPDPIQGDSLLAALVSGGISNVDTSTVVAAVSVALANKFNMFSIPDKMAELMLEFAKKGNKPVNLTILKLIETVTKRDYAPVFGTFEGSPSKYVTKATRNDLFKNIDTYLWPALFDFFKQLQVWQTEYMKNAPTATLINLVRPGTNQVGMMPSTATLRAQASALIDSINKVFSGFGQLTAVALTCEANSIKKIINDDKYPPLIGAPDREQMLKELGIEVSFADQMVESSLIQFIMCCDMVKTLPMNDNEYQFFDSMYNVGKDIPWDKLGADGDSSGISRIKGTL